MQAVDGSQDLLFGSANSVIDERSLISSGLPITWVALFDGFVSRACAISIKRLQVRDGRGTGDVAPIMVKTK
jgi:hypothetical protein